MAPTLNVLIPASKQNLTEVAMAKIADFLTTASPKAGENKFGPSLAGVFGRKSGSAPGYDYSSALKSAGITWDEQELDKYLTNPPADVHGTKMVISVPSAEDRQNVIAYLKTLK
jgi:cytochrome c